MGMRSTVAGALGERKVILTLFPAIDATLCKLRDLVRQKVTVVRTLHSLWNLRFWILRGMQDQRLTFNERPFNRLFGAIDFDGFAVLTRHIEQRAIHQG